MAYLGQWIYRVCTRYYTAPNGSLVWLFMLEDEQKAMILCQNCNPRSLGAGGPTISVEFQKDDAILYEVGNAKLYMCPECIRKASIPSGNPLQVIPIIHYE